MSREGNDVRLVQPNHAPLKFNPFEVSKIGNDVRLVQLYHA